MVGPRLGSAQPEQRLHHPRDLLLGRAAVAADRALDLLGRVAEARHAALAGGQHHDPARLADRERGAHVLAEVQLLERHRVGLVLLQQLLHGRVDVGQPALLRRSSAAVSITPPSSASRRPPRRSDDAVAGARQAGVDAEHDHGRVILRRCPDACLPYACTARWPASDIDFAAEGLLDGLEGERARASASRCSSSSPADGVPLETAPHDRGRHARVPARRPRDRRHAALHRRRRSPSSAASSSTSCSPRAARWACRSPSPTKPPSPTPTSRRRAAATSPRDAGISDEDLLDLLRVLGRGLAQAAETHARAAAEARAASRGSASASSPTTTREAVAPALPAASTRC